jgi:hypothetical protein
MLYASPDVPELMQPSGVMYVPTSIPVASAFQPYVPFLTIIVDIYANFPAICCPLCSAGVNNCLATPVFLPAVLCEVFVLHNIYVVATRNRHAPSNASAGQYNERGEYGMTQYMSESD